VTCGIIGSVFGRAHDSVSGPSRFRTDLAVKQLYEGKTLY
jgi:hypothetical protein